MAEETVLTFGFTFLSGAPGVMPSEHRHRELEVNLVAAGEMTYLFDGSRLTLSSGQIGVFWATIPHKVIRRTEGTRFYCIHLPLARFLQWQMPDTLTSRLLHGELVREPSGIEAWDDEKLFERWRRDLETPSQERTRIVLLELEARLRRLACAMAAGGAAKTRGGTYAGGETDKVEAMASFMAGRYGDPLTMDDIANSVGLHPKYAMTLFRRHCGMTLGQYLTQQRLSQAQRLLLTTDAKVVDIAFASGFGSLSRFYEVFERACDQSPTAYRVSHRG